MVHETPGMRQRHGRPRARAGGWPYAVLTALVLVSGSADIFLPPLGGAAVGSADPDQPPSGVEDYCRIRREATSEIRLVTSATAGPVAALPVAHDDDRRRPEASEGPRRPRSSTSEHRPLLSRRSRAPGRPVC